MMAFHQRLPMPSARLLFMWMAPLVKKSSAASKPPAQGSGSEKDDTR